MHKQILFAYSSATATISNFENTGVVEGGNYVGGSIGWFHADAYAIWESFTLNAFEFKHSGEVKGGLYVGGWIGYGYSDSDSSLIQDSSATGNVHGTKWCGKYVGGVDGIEIEY